MAAPTSLAAARATTAAAARFARPLPEHTVLFLCDLQERFRGLIHRFPSVVRSADTLARTAAALGVPTVVTEQYPKAFQPTVAELAHHLRSDAHPAGAPVFPKLRFSMWTDEVAAHVARVAPGAQHVVLCGIEAHVCVQQTALDVLAAGKACWVVVDGVSSQRPADRAVALALLRDAGATLTTTESLIMMLLGGAEHPQFKPVQRILVAHNAAAAAAGEPQLGLE